MSVLLLGALAESPISAMDGYYNPKIEFAKTMAKQMAAFATVAAFSGVAYCDGTSDFWAGVGMAVGAVGMAATAVSYCIIAQKDIKNYVFQRVVKSRNRNKLLVDFQ